MREMGGLQGAKFGNLGDYCCTRRSPSAISVASTLSLMVSLSNHEPPAMPPTPHLYRV